MTNDQRFRIIEIFGPTIQGEGALAGHVTHFIRFAGCDRRCLWCDTKGAVEPKLFMQPGASSLMTVPDIVRCVTELRMKAPWTTLSGGNPLLFELDELVSELQVRGLKVAIETQGSLHKAWANHADFITVSPKPPSAGYDITDIDFNVLESLLQDRDESCLKFVVSDAVDLEFAITVAKRFRYTSVYVQPCDLSPTLDHGLPASQTALRFRYAGLIRLVLNEPRASEFIVLPQLHKMAEVR